MNKTLVGLGALVILLCSGVVLVVVPHFNILRTSDRLQKSRQYSDEVTAGRQVYVDLGCVYCHSQQPRHRNFGPDFERGWGRQPDAADYLGQKPHQLGTMRTGPDLFNIGDRNPSVQWHLIHLYNPRLLVPWSIMPAYPFLFERKTQIETDDLALNLRAMVIEEESHIVATQRAKDLVTYLKALKQEDANE